MPNLRNLVLNWHYLCLDDYDGVDDAPDAERVLEWGVRTPVQHVHLDYINKCITGTDTKFLLLSTDDTSPFHCHARKFWNGFEWLAKRANVKVQVQGTVLARCGILVSHVSWL